MSKVEVYGQLHGKFLVEPTSAVEAIITSIIGSGPYRHVKELDGKFHIMDMDRFDDYESVGEITDAEYNAVQFLTKALHQLNRIHNKKMREENVNSI